MAPYDPAFSPRSTTFKGVMLNSTSVPALSSYGLPMAPVPIDERRYGIMGPDGEVTFPDGPIIAGADFGGDEIVVTGARDLKTV